MFCWYEQEHLSWTKKTSKARRSRQRLIEEVAGKILDDKGLELKGKADQLGGIVRDPVGTAKDAIKDAVKEAKRI